MRFFIALEIPEQSRLQLEVVQKKLSQFIPAVNLTDNNKLHLTIAFIGEQPASMQPKFEELIKKAIEGIPAFKITPAYIDAFPNIHHPNIFWVGVKGDIDRLLILRERIKDGLVAVNRVVDERRFTPHIAIAKVKKFTVNPKLEEKLQQLLPIPFDPIEIRSIKLFESLPNQGFHKHNTLAEVNLTG